MKIAEIYKSVQGEGLLTGTPSVFVRVSGCNLRCWFCDTPFASWAPEGSDIAIDEIVAQVEEWDCRHVVLTGGEPMLFVPWSSRLRRRNCSRSAWRAASAEPLWNPPHRRPRPIPAPFRHV